MANACGIRIAINGSETDVDVEADSAAWTSKVGRVRITGGGGSWMRQPNPFTCNVDVMVPAELAPLIHTITIGLSLVASTVSTLPAGTIAGSTPYKIIFNGSVSHAKTSMPEAPVQIDFMEDVQGYLSRRAGVAAAPNTGIRALLDDIETAHSDTIAGNDQFPSAADFPNLDRPAQNRATNGDMIRTALAGTGINLSSEWTGSMTAPEFRWRPDYFDSVYSASVSTTRQWSWEAGYPWLLGYPDIGIIWNDFVARISVDGIDSADQVRNGWARLSDTAMRAALGRREANVKTWMDSTSDLQRAARRLMAFQGEPTYSHLYQLTIPIEPMYRKYLADGAVDAEIETLTAAGLLPGDLITARNPWNDTHPDYGDWPTATPYGGTVGDTLNALWYPSVTDNGAGTIVVEHVVKTVTREYTAAGGWVVTYGLDPHGANGGLVGTDIASYGNNTYGSIALIDFWSADSQKFPIKAVW